MAKSQKRILSAQTVTVMAVLLALNIIVGFIPSVGIPPYVEMGFGFIVTAFAASILGPILAPILWMVGDIISFYLQGGGYFFPGFTLSAAVAALIYALFLYQKPKTLKQIVLAVLFVTIIVNLGLNSLWIRIMFDRAWGVFMGVRLIKNIISLPVNVFILYFLFKQPTVKRLMDKVEKMVG